MKIDGVEVETEEFSQRKFPWYIDVWLYPCSLSGVVHLLVFIAVPILINFFGWVVNRVFVAVGFLFGSLPFGLLCAFIALFVAAYILFYFTECIHSSASGELRAPDTQNRGVSDINEIGSRMLYVIGCCLICFGPAVLSAFFLTRYPVIFWVLLISGVFFFPMALLAAIIFDSFLALNPVLIFGSIFSAFFKYCRMVLVWVLAAAVIVKIMPTPGKSVVLFYIIYASYIYLAFVVAHILGRFFYCNQKKLNWDV